MIPPAEFPVFVSQQGYDSKVTNVIESYTKEKKLFHIGFDYEKDVTCYFFFYFVCCCVVFDYPCAKVLACDPFEQQIYNNTTNNKIKQIK